MGVDNLQTLFNEIEWRVRLNNRVVTKNTEQDLNHPPNFFWRWIKVTTGDVLCGKIARDRRVRPDDVTVVVSVNDRSQRDLTKRFEDSGINRNNRNILGAVHLPRNLAPGRLSINVAHYLCRRIRALIKYSIISFSSSIHVLCLVERLSENVCAESKSIQRTLSRSLEVTIFLG